MSLFPEVLKPMMVGRLIAIATGSEEIPFSVAERAVGRKITAEDWMRAERLGDKRSQSNRTYYLKRTGQNWKAI